MEKLKIVTFPGVIKVNPSTLNKIFSADHFIFAKDHYDDILLEADIFIQTNLIKLKFFDNYRHECYRAILESGKPKLVLESPVFRSIKTNNKKTGLIRLGWNSYQHHNSDYNNQNCSPERWNYLAEKYSLNYNTWKQTGEYVLFTLQKPGDSSLNEIYANGDTYWNWVLNTTKEIRKHTDRKIVLRPHINQQTIAKSHAADIASQVENTVISKNYKWVEEFGASGGSGLQKDLENAWCCITYNSLSGIEAVMSGTPVIALHKGAMCYPVAHKKLSDIENLDRTIDINQWLYNLAYTTWEREDLFSGKTWSHLKEKYTYWKLQTQKQKDENLKEYDLLKFAHGKH